MALANSSVNFLLRRAVRKPSTQRGRPKPTANTAMHDHQRRLVGDEGRPAAANTPSTAADDPESRAAWCWESPPAPGGGAGWAFPSCAALVLFHVLEQGGDILALLGGVGLRLDARPRSCAVGLATAADALLRALVAAGEGERHAAQRQHREQDASTMIID